MPETINWLEEHARRPGQGGNLLAHLLLEAVSMHFGAADKGHPFWDGFDSKKLEVSLTVNGHEVPIRPVMEFWEKQWDAIVLAEARKIHRDAVSGRADIQRLMAHFQDVASHVEAVLDEASRKAIETFGDPYTGTNKLPVDPATTTGG